MARFPLVVRNNFNLRLILFREGSELFPLPVTTAEVQRPEVACESRDAVLAVPRDVEV